MNSVRRTRSRQSPKAREALSERDIIATALRVMQRDGVQALSMRRLAAELGVTPMAIYYHVPHKRALIERITDSLLEAVPRPEPSGTHWERELKNAALEGWQRLSAYPGLGAALLERARPTKQGRALLRYNMMILVAAGFDARTAGMATAVYSTFVFGVMSGQAKFGKQQKSKRGKASDAENPMEKLDVRLLMEYGLDTLIAGMRAQLAQSGKKAAPSVKPRRSRTRALQQPAS